MKQVGGSLVVSIPRAMAKTLNLTPGERVKMRLMKQGISISKSKK
ncbi:MAG: AbrB/MazE/SpoVT family DNA-binding domain-containing protein [Candidatus Hodarchaeaceae archaeon]|nr:AbrB/MazE/SpoVT family DNA-binding domain-containing protein [Candidatus Hodarchaeaceae archaeon]